MNSRRADRFLIGLLVLWPWLGGCSALSLVDRASIPTRATPQNPAVEIVCLWQPAKGPGLNHVPTRGLAGRILFFSRRNPSPIIVDGAVRVYLFDNQGTPEEQARPIHQFDFRPEDWNSCGTTSTLGPSYSVFIPYVRGGRDQVECSVQLRFTPKDGPTIYSDLISVTLPGHIDPAELQPGLAAVSAARQVQDDDVLRSGLRVHTIHEQPIVRQAGYASVPAAIPPAAISGDRPARAVQRLAAPLGERAATPSDFAAAQGPQEPAADSREPRRFRLQPSEPPPRRLNAHPLESVAEPSEDAPPRRATRHPLAEEPLTDDAPAHSAEHPLAWDEGETRAAGAWQSRRTRHAVHP